ncbi:MAG: PAS-domain containing protein [Proteobacteria bacterium]|nr:PAS-domain containing protein [Pseudomonadota bacterium]
MRLGLQSRYALAILPLIALLVGVFIALLFYQINRQADDMRKSSANVLETSLFQKMENNGRALALLLAENLINDVYRMDLADIGDAIAATRRRKDVDYVYVFDTSGRVLHDGTEDNAAFGRMLDDSHIRLALDATEPVVWIDDTLNVAAAIRLGPEVLGGVSVGLSLKPVHRDLAALKAELDTLRQGHVQDHFVWSVAAALALLVVGVLVTIMLARNLSRPITTLARLTSRIGQGRYDVDIPIERSDEIGTLADSLRKMVDDLRHTTVSKAYVDNILATTLDALIVVAPDGAIQTVNPAACKLLGYGADELIGQPVEKIVAKEENGDGEAANSALIEPFPAGDVESALIAKDGGEIPVLISGARMRDADGNLEGIVYAARDITARKRAEEEIATKSALLETTLESMSQGIVAYDGDLKLVAFNQNYIDFWGYPPGFIRLGMSYEEVARFRAKRGEFGSIDVEEQLRISVAAIHSGDALRAERTLPDGTVLALRRDPLPDGGIVATFTDITERKRAEEAVRESEERLAGILDIADDAVISMDEDHRIILFNKGAERTFGCEAEEVLGEPIELLLPAEFREEHRHHVDNFAEGADVARKMGERGEVAGRRKDGTEFPCEASISRLDLNGSRIFTVILRDVTARQQAEEAVAKQSALLETTFETMNQGITVYDADNRLVAFNQKFVDLLDFPPGFVRTGMPFEEIVRFNAERGEYGPGDVEELVRERIVAGDRGEINPRERTRPNGTVISARRDPMPGGGHVTTYSDITERKRAEEALRESEARLVNAQRIASLGNWERNLETGEVHWSDQMYDIFAITPDQFAGTYEAFLERVHPDDRELIEEAGRRALDEKAPLDIEYRIVRPDTSERVIHSHREVEFDAAGKPVRLNGTAQDITERKSLEERIRQIQKLDAVGKLAGGVAHEFNNLLFVIKGNIDLLEARLNGDPELRRYVELISRQTRRGSYLTHLLVAYARQQPLRPKEMDINDVVRETTNLLEGSLSDAIEIDAVCAQDLWTTLVDRAELECAIVNLAVNAQDAMPEGGKLTVETVNIRIDGEHAANGGDAEPGEYVKLAVTDTGCGMAAVVAERAFEPFFTTKEVGKGTGLGLSMVYGFVNQSGGYVTIDSELGNGTTVSIYLPKATEAQA